MQEKFVIWIKNTAASDAHWLVLDARGNRIGFPQQGALQDAAALAANRRVIALLPGERILAASTHVPGNNPKRILQAAPYAMEDKLAGDVEALHVALLNQGADQLCDFMVVEREWLAAVLERLSAAGIHPDHAWPDYLAVPVEDAAAHWLVTGDGRLLSRDGWQGFAAAAADAGVLHAHRDDEVPLKLTLVGEQPPPLALGELEVARLADDEQAFTELAATAAAFPGPGLLQGAFRRTREGAMDWRRWRWPAAAAAAWLLFLLADFGVDSWRLQREHAFLEQATRDLFQQALPGNQRMIDPRFQIEQALGSGGDSGNRLLSHLADVATALQDIPNARLNGFNFRNDHFEFSVTVPDATTLESLRAALAERAALPVSVQSANSTRDGLEGRLLLAEETAR
ncbi:MAG TPA: type II secretion system protein GspL [Gammaproteobacteria bacterium]